MNINLTQEAKKELDKNYKESSFADLRLYPAGAV